MNYYLDLKNLKEKNIFLLGENFKGSSKKGEEIAFTNYYMMKNGAPFFGISGEFHFSRMEDGRWEDELIKMKMCGINVVATYVFWIHHEEEEGIFDFSGRKNVRRFIELCQKHGLYVILRVGPFDHGEVRNGGIPDWMYGKPFEVRKLSEGFLYYTRRLYARIAKEVSGLFFQDNGPIIGVQIDNEYRHSSAPWEMTTGISNEWVFRGDEGDTYMLRMKELAAECGLLPVFYTCTGWGGASTPDSMMPLWGGYAFRPWMFYSYKGEHPATEEYVYQDFHNNDVECTNDFKPLYRPEDRPYACCEMGGGMTCCYYYRFRYPYKSVDAMANIKMASGCNFLGYYMFQGGSNPLGKHGVFMNESQVPKISYDYQAALGEFGQVRESYRRLKILHYFASAFAAELCGLQTVLPEGASAIASTDAETLRFAVRTDGERGFVFINNYQDHFQMKKRKDERLTLHLDDEEITYQLGIDVEENAILPFRFDMGGINLIRATAQPVTRLAAEGRKTYVFMAPAGMEAGFKFEEGTAVNNTDSAEYFCKANMSAEKFTVKKEGNEIDVLVISREMADKMFLVGKDKLIFTDAALLVDEKGMRLETTDTVNTVFTYPAGLLDDTRTGVERVEHELDFLLGCYQVQTKEVYVKPEIKKVSYGRYTIVFPKKFMTGVKDMLLQIDYSGDIGHAFIDGRMVHDNFANGAVWEIGLKDFAKELENSCLTVYITPLKEGANVNVESAMAARIEEAEAYIAELKDARVQPVYEIAIA